MALAFAGLEIALKEAPQMAGSRGAGALFAERGRGCGLRPDSRGQAAGGRLSALSMRPSRAAAHSVSASAPGCSARSI